MRYKRQFRQCLVLLPLMTALWSGGVHAQDAFKVMITQIDSSQFPLITLYISVTDSQSSPFTGLAPTMMTVREDGRPVEIVEFSGSGDEPVTTLLVLDRSASMQGEKLSGAQAAAQAFVDLMRPQDRSGLLLFAAQAVLAQPLTNDRVALSREIAQTQVDSSTALYDAVLAGMDVLKDVQGRKSLIVLSDGMDNSDTWQGWWSSAGSSHTLKDVVKRASSDSVPIYTIGLGAQTDLNEAALDQIAQQTGGRYFHSPSAAELGTLYTSLSQQFQTEYKVSYRSPRASYDGTRRGIEVTIDAGRQQTGRAVSLYVERHLLQMRSNPAVGLGLMGVLIGALIVPMMVRRRRVVTVRSTPAPAPAAPASAQAWTAPPTQVQAPAAPPTQVQPTATISDKRCVNCDGHLRNTARFCHICGSRQP